MNAWKSWTANALLPIGILFISYHGWWVLLGGFVVGVWQGIRRIS